MNLLIKFIKLAAEAHRKTNTWTGLRAVFGNTFEVAGV